MRDSDGRALLTRRELAAATGATLRQIRHLHDAGVLAGVRGPDGCWWFSPAHVGLVRARVRVPSAKSSQRQRNGASLDARIAARLAAGASNEEVVIAEGCTFERVAEVQRHRGAVIIDADERRKLELELDLSGEPVDWTKTGSLLAAVCSLAVQHRRLRHARVLALHGELEALRTWLTRSD